jgi:hypothetical protein
VNLTHKSSDWCWAIVEGRSAIAVSVRLVVAFKVDVVNGEGTDVEEHHTRAFDRLCLGLALLTNLAHEASDTKDLIRDTSKPNRGSPVCVPLTSDA